jgi:hypothetical protein
MNQAPGPQTTGGLARFAKFVVFAVFFAVGVAGFFLGNPAHRLQASQDEACRARCADVRKFHRLVPALPPGAVPQGKYDGPWNCECY